MGPLPTHHPRSWAHGAMGMPSKGLHIPVACMRQGPVRGLNGIPARIEQMSILTSYNKDIMMTSCGRPLRWIRMWPGAWSSR